MKRSELKDSDFGLPKLRKYPLIDAVHVKSAISYFYKCDEKNREELATNIFKAQVRLKMEVHKRNIYYDYINDKLLSKEELKYKSNIITEAVTLDKISDNTSNIRWSAISDRNLIFGISNSNLYIIDSSSRTYYMLQDGIFKKISSQDMDSISHTILVNFDRIDLAFILDRLTDQRYKIPDIILNNIYSGLKGFILANIELCIREIVQYFGYSIPFYGWASIPANNLSEFLSKVLVYKPDIYFMERCAMKDLDIYKMIKSDLDSGEALSRILDSTYKRYPPICESPLKIFLCRLLDYLYNKNKSVVITDITMRNTISTYYNICKNYTNNSSMCIEWLFQQ